jgi:putative hydrolase of the HAD superfamily
MFKPKAIIFDLGGVIVNLNYDATAKAFKDLGIENFDEVYSKRKQERLFDDFEKGITSPLDFRNIIRKNIPQQVTDVQIDKAWNAMLLDVPPERIKWLQQLSKKYRIYLLSNTNEIHIKAITHSLIDTYGENIFERTFEKIYYSSRMNKRKPDAEIFEYVLRENKLIADETLFVDDSEQHIKGAEKIGLNVFQMKTNEEISKALHYLL